MPSPRRIIVQASGKRKTAIARVTVKPGKGRIRINSCPLEIYVPDIAREKLMEPIVLSKDMTKEMDIDVRIHGGGFMGQAEAARMAIARALVKISRGTALRRVFNEYDRAMLSGDPRRKEPKKFGGPGARRRKQKSYR
ncbi:MAG: 30S ribosomal protein S9 [Candidatus Bathyarchaeia archaeon]